VYTGVPSSSTKEIIISPDDLASYSYGTVNEFTYSIWIYINDWNTFYGEKKTIFKRAKITKTATGTSIGDSVFELYLDNNANNLIAETSVIKNTDYTYYDNTNLTSGTTGTTYTVPSGSSMNEVKAFCGSKCTENCAGYTYNNSSCVFHTGSAKTELTGALSAIKSGVSKCVVPSIDTQRWVNIVVSGSVSSIDMYIDGKLIKTALVNDKLAQVSDTSVIICPSGKGFSGWNAKFKFYPKYMSPSEIWKIYKNGYNGILGDINFNYSLTFGIYKGDVEKASVTF